MKAHLFRIQLRGTRTRTRTRTRNAWLDSVQLPF
jgi:hypothetical protein